MVHLRQGNQDGLLAKPGEQGSHTAQPGQPFPLGPLQGNAPAAFDGPGALSAIRRGYPGLDEKFCGFGLAWPNPAGEKPRGAVPRPGRQAQDNRSCGLASLLGILSRARGEVS